LLTFDGGWHQAHHHRRHPYLAIQGFFSVPVEIMSVLPVFGHHIRTRLEDEGIDLDQVVVVSPDHGSALRARDLASLLPNSHFALIDKRRPARTRLKSAR
jgi:phosphoribosylpyrophosphate synthetase